jgi:hypothetical protein
LGGKHFELKCFRESILAVSLEESALEKSALEKRALRWHPVSRGQPILHPMRVQCSEGAIHLRSKISPSCSEGAIRTF